MTFEKLSRADAERYCARIEADHEPRLSELARRLSEAGYDLEAFDGGLHSFGALWEWALSVARSGFADMSSQFRRTSVERREGEVPPQGHLAELLAHYTFEVAQRWYADVRWSVLRQPGFADHQRTVVSYRDSAGLVATAFPLEYYYDALWMVDHPEYGDAGWLAGAVLKGPLRGSPDDEARVRALPTGASLLLPYLGGDEDTPDFDLSAADDAASDPADEGLVGDELVLVRPGSSVEQLERARPIDADAVVETLARLGFKRMSGEIPTVDDILVNEFTEFLLDETAMAITLAWRGKLRAVQLSSIRAYPVPWAELVGEFTALGERIGAKLAREDEF